MVAYAARSNDCYWSFIANEDTRISGYKFILVAADVLEFHVVALFLLVVRLMRYYMLSDKRSGRIQGRSGWSRSLRHQGAIAEYGTDAEAG